MPSFPAGFVDAARSLQLDLVAAEVGSALTAVGVSAIVIRGPSLRRWIYPEGAARNYIDVDLLVAPEQFELAEQTVAACGFEHVALMMQRSDDQPVHARTWYRPADSAAVDLHRTIVGARAPHELVWDVLRRETETIRVAEVELHGLSAAATAVVVALHAAQHGQRAAKPLTDLRQALERLPRTTWQRAEDIARRLDAIESLAVGLRLTPAGTRLADELRLPTEITPESVLRAGTSPPTALGFEWLTHVPGVRAKARLLAAKVVPDIEFMRAWSSVARRGRAGLALAYLWRPLWLVWHTPRGLLAWGQARRRARAGLPLER